MLLFYWYEKQDESGGLRQNHLTILYLSRSSPEFSSHWTFLSVPHLIRSPLANCSSHHSFRFVIILTLLLFSPLALMKFLPSCLTLMGWPTDFLWLSLGISLGNWLFLVHWQFFKRWQWHILAGCAIATSYILRWYLYLWLLQLNRLTHMLLCEPVPFSQV